MTQFPHIPQFATRLAQSPEDIRAAQHLRYDVFVQELGARGVGVDHAAQLETDAFDPFFDHLMLWDLAADDAPRLAGVYRLLRGDMLERVGQFYTADEYDLSALMNSDLRLLELGRSCVAAPYRGGPALMYLWAALADYVEEHRIDVLFGVASFHGTDVEALAPSLALLHDRHLAPEAICPVAREGVLSPQTRVDINAIDRVQAMAAVPPLIKGYLKLGATIGQGAYIDHAFNTTDVCIVMETAKVNWAQARRVIKGRST